MKNSLVRINSKALLNKITEIQLKRYWIAQEAGIHKTTLRRWISGQSHRGNIKKLERLAFVLGGSEREFIFNPEP